MTEDQRPVSVAEFKASMANLEAALGAQKMELEGFIRQVETNILTAFHGYARGVSTRLHTLDTGEQDVRARLGILEDRVLALETRRHG